MNNRIHLLDPTSEVDPVERKRKPPPKTLDGCTVALLDIGKARGDVFLDELGTQLSSRGLKVRHYAKPTNTKVAPIALKQQIAHECEVVIEALSD